MEEENNNVISRYVCLFTTIKNSTKGYFIYCSRTNSFIKINKEIFQEITLAKKTGIVKSSSFIPELFEALEKAKIIVGSMDDDAYVRQCEIQTYLDNFASSHMSLSLAPTSACNFICPYCYEKSKPNNTMSNETINNLVTFINGHKNVKTIAITWYGGEPLVAFETIKKIIQKINTECNAKITSQDIVTNGYNFNHNIIDFFKKYPLERIQITIDGPEEEHNKLRKLSNGKGTYKKIISNIYSIVQEMPKTNLVIRINIGKNNQKGYSILCKELQDKFSNKISVYPGFLRINDEKQTHLICTSMKQKDAIFFYEQLEKEGCIDVDYYPHLCKNRGCVATCTTAYVIGPLGELYKCWNDLGNKRKIIGNINQSRFTNPDLYNQYMIDGQWTSDDICKKCFFLPICKGGCAWQRVRNKFHNGKYNFCSIYKEGGMEYFLKMQYNKLNKNLKQ